MSDLFSSTDISSSVKIYTTKDLRESSILKMIKSHGFDFQEIDDQTLQNVEQAIVLCFPGKGRLFDESLHTSNIIIVIDADKALERVLSKRCFFLSEQDHSEDIISVFYAIEDILRLRSDLLSESQKVHDWDQRAHNALSDFDYLTKSLTFHKQDDVHNDSALLELLDFYVLLLAIKERSVSLTESKSFWELLISSFPDFKFEFDSTEVIPVGKRKWNVYEIQKSKYSVLKVMGIVFLVSEFQEQLQLIENQKNEGQVWSDALAQFPHPIALVSSGGDLIAHNASFTQLNLYPRDCLDLKLNQTIELKSGLYRVFKQKLEHTSGDVDESLFAFAFLSQTQRPQMGSSEELGIISSSIAHELNNPIAGILASITLLELEDNWDHESVETLREMKISARRCKELIEIFLGFSRATPRNTQIVTAGLGAFEKALSLSRFRMIENNLRIEMDASCFKTFHRNMNSAILSMIWYLILSDLMTARSHHSLVVGKSTALVGSFIEKELSLELTIKENFEWKERIQSSKLISHLVELAGLSIIFEEEKLILRDWTLT